MKLLLALLCLAYNFLPAAVLEDKNYVETQIDDYSYSITFVKRDKQTPSATKHAALVYAARLGYKKDFTYFTLDSSEDVVVSISKTEVHPGFKIFITYYHDRPSSGEIYEVCNIIFCR
jgi:hypothetical protein